jgi:hypothetical protein
MKKTIFVEGKDDKSFIEALNNNASVKEIVIDDMGGGGQANNALIIKKLKAFVNDFQINPSEKLGIILDLDNYSPKERLDFLNDCVNDVLGVRLDEVGIFKSIELYEMPLQIGCYFVKPNLDVLLRKIASQQAIVADCLYSCLEKENVKQKERDKAWVFYYMRYDICDAQERIKAQENVTFNYTASKGAWDLDSQHLADLKAFLNFSINLLKL